MEEKVHVIGATGGILFGSLFIATFGFWYALTAILFTVFVLYCHFVAKYNWAKWMHNPPYKFNIVERLLIKLPRVYNHTWWIEVIAFVLIAGSIFIKSVWN